MVERAAALVDQVDPLIAEVGVADFLDVSEDLAAMCAEFEKHGPAAIAKVREENPAAFLTLVAEVATLLDGGD